MRLRVTTNERGAALLFAMGLLALFLLLAMAFAANSLLQRKIAANRSSRAMVEVIADSALERARTALFYYQSKLDFLDSNSDINTLETEFASTTPKNELDGGEVDAALLKVEKLDGTLLGLDDYKACPNLLAAVAPHPTNCTYCDNWKFPQWQLVKNSQAAAVEEVVGRFAYILIPPGPRYFFERDKDDLSWCHTFEEFMTKEIIPTANPNKLRFPTRSELLTIKQEVEIYNPANLEAYVYSKAVDIGANGIPRRPLPGDFYKRFNLNRNDWDTITPDKLLAKNAQRFFAGTGSDDDFVLANYDSDKNPTLNSTAVDSIQFLCRIGDKQETFPNIGDRRLQIAANLIDYCDGNDDPTSDIGNDPDPGDTDLETSSWIKKTPSYTGNENTWFIDRIAIVSRPNLEAEVLNNSTKLNIRMSKDQNALLVGLVDVYNTDKSIDYQAQVKLGNLKFSYVVSGTLMYTYSYKDLSSTTPEEVIGPIAGTTTFPLLDVTGDLTGISDTLVTVDFPAANQVGYRAAAKGFEAFPGTNTPFLLKDFGDDFEKWVAVNDIAFNKIINDPTTKTITALNWVGGDITVKINSADVGIDRIALLRKNTGNFRNADAAILNFNEQYTISDYVSYRNNNGAITQGDIITLGGLFAKDPRQNLFAEDWNLTPTSGNGKANGTIADIFGATFAFNLANPFINESLQSDLEPLPMITLPGRDPSAGADKESVKTPAWMGSGVNEHLSTAFFRNGPMESLAELGFIHRGAMWETLNLSNAAQPNVDGNNVGKPVQPNDYAPDADYKTVQGTSYKQGDGGLLDQVTVSDKNRRYDLFNLNLRDGNGTLNTNFVGDEYFRQLLEKIRIGTLQDGSPSLDLLTSDTAGNAITDFTTVAQTLIGHLNWRFINEKDTPTPPLYANRAQLLWYMNPNPGINRFYNAYGNMDGNVGTLAINKALQDELCAKVMEYSSAGELPTVFRALVLAQSIRDIGADSPNENDAFDISIDQDGNGKKNFSVLLGRYEEGADEITGQLRMIVTFVRDPITFKVLIKDIEYIED